MSDGLRSRLIMTTIGLIQDPIFLISDFPKI
jgi:hypothetical protein